MERIRNLALILGSFILLTTSGLNLNPPRENSRYECNRSDAIVPGGLYFYDNENLLSDRELMRVLNKVQSNFCDAGIKFYDAAIFRNRNFPRLNGLDLLIFVEEENNGREGRFSLEESDYIKMKSLFDFSYEEKTSKAHIGFIWPNFSIARAEKFLGRILTNNERSFLVAQVGTHEIAHGLGASHLQSYYKPNSIQLYFMGNRTVDNEQSFHKENVFKMKKFIEEAQTKSLGKTEIIELRGKYLIKEHKF